MSTTDTKAIEPEVLDRDEVPPAFPKTNNGDYEDDDDEDEEDDDEDEDPTELHHYVIGLTGGGQVMVVDADDPDAFEQRVFSVKPTGRVRFPASGSLDKFISCPKCEGESENEGEPDCSLCENDGTIAIPVGVKYVRRDLIAYIEETFPDVLSAIAAEVEDDEDEEGDDEDDAPLSGIALPGQDS